MRLLLLLTGLLLALVALAAEARMHHPYRGHRITAAGGTPPLDAFAAPSGAYGFRKLKSTYSGPAIRIRRASDNAEIDVNFLGFTGFTGAPWDAVAATAHCAATTCWGRTWYDQSGNARDLNQATAANQPQLIFNCNGSLPCWRFTATTQAMQGASFTPATQITTLNVVANRSAGTSAGGTFIRSNGSFSRLQPSSANLWSVGTGPVTATATDTVWHSAIGVMVTTAGASVLRIDDVETAGTTTPVLTAGAPGVIGFTGSTLDVAEGVFWDGYQLTPAERAALVANQRSYGLIP